jgi:hypothetical protein
MPGWRKVVLEIAIAFLALIVLTIAIPIMQRAGKTAAPALAVPAISNPDQGCDVFMETIYQITAQGMTDTEATPSLQALVAASREHDPLLASDVQSMIGAPSSTVSAQAQVILRRCVSGGYMTVAEVQGWGRRMQGQATNLP